MTEVLIADSVVINCDYCGKPAVGCVGLAAHCERHRWLAQADMEYEAPSQDTELTGS
jgi:hypothetical protein